MLGVTGVGTFIRFFKNRGILFNFLWRGVSPKTVSLGLGPAQRQSTLSNPIM
jgi:hypothetical protein